MRTLAVSLVLVMVFAVALNARGFAPRRGRMGQFGQNGGERPPRPFRVLGMRGFAVSDDSYELLGLNIVGPPKGMKADDESDETEVSDETEETEISEDGEQLPPLRGIIHIAGDAYALKDVEVTFEDFSVETPEGEEISGKRPSAFTATLCKLPERESLADSEASEASEASETSETSEEEKPELEEVGSLSLTIEPKDIGKMKRPAAKGEATIDGTTWTLYGAVDGPRPPRRPRENNEDSANGQEDDSETADVVEEGF